MNLGRIVQSLLVNLANIFFILSQIHTLHKVNRKPEVSYVDTRRENNKYICLHAIELIELV
jgi:hypothetical protein